MRLLFMLFLCLSFRPGLAVPYAEIPNPKSQGQWVVDQGNILSSGQQAQITSWIKKLEQQNGTELAVVIVTECNGMTPREYAQALRIHWGLGKKGLNNGLLYLVALQEQRMEIATGEGIRNHLPDSHLKILLRDRIIPHFRDGMPAQGVVLCTQVLCQSLQGVTYGANTASPPSEPKTSPPAPNPSDSVRASQIRDALYWGLILGAGGGLLGVPVGAYLLYRAFRYRKRRCPYCRQPMVRLDEVADDEYLSEGQRVEEKIGSVDYDVWLCGKCQSTDKSSYLTLLSGYSDCPECACRTLKSHTVVLRKATQSSEGEQVTHSNCMHCSYTHETHQTLPRFTPD